ncbi:MAG TPA: GDSL-type esterase/lipase family protein [Leptospiraceae bacterium]|nr:hypothetical protein [Leptospirales bacterium]HMU85045.1 GDSL-type esterase/lipase family protein [Leptospiraceae bacterium]HMX57974.1 GDSL-type esterase/lipase family protein [Leptospiraceae bacterium]HMZ36832.1 GDSL-type esterase/lipase family protein [Leptospiraceae bacterium]HNE23676.1 GDSL-type esterase/lipase family protein [Leptospiraceae bacterium]
MRFRIVIFTFCFVLSCARVAAVPPSTRVVFFGDSITEIGVRQGGYIQRMQTILSERGLSDRFELMGAGVSGDKIYDLYLRLEDDVFARNPQVVVVWVGVNDVWHKQIHNTGTDAVKFKRFYVALIRKLQARNMRVILVTPMGVGEKRNLANPLDQELDQYSALIRDLAVQYHCDLVDMRAAFLKYVGSHNPLDRESGILTYDRVHPNDTGNQFVANEMLRVLLR